MMRGGRLAASSRLRVLQFVPRLRALGWHVDTHALHDDDYIRNRYAGRWMPIARSLPLRYLDRLRVVLEAGDYDLLWIGSEALPWLPAWCEKALFKIVGKPVVIDFDDAVWVRYRECGIAPLRWALGRKVARLMAASDAVVAGSPEIAGYARESGARRVVAIPTVVDTRRYSAGARDPGGEPVVCWIGTPSTAQMLDVAAQGFTEAAKKRRFRLRSIGARAPDWSGVATETLPWSEETEARDVGAATVGIMPLWDGPFQRGKCGCKLIQYMAAGLPVIASPVGVNRTIVRDGWNGYLAGTSAEWESALLRILDDPDRAREMGRHGRALVEREYSLDSAAPQLSALIEEVFRGHPTRADGSSGACAPSAGF